MMVLMAVPKVAAFQVAAERLAKPLMGTLGRLALSAVPWVGQ